MYQLGTAPPLLLLPKRQLSTCSQRVENLCQNAGARLNYCCRERVQFEVTSGVANGCQTVSMRVRREAEAGVLPTASARSPRIRTLPARTDSNTSFPVSLQSCSV